jgi:hypothetical protein
MQWLGQVNTWGGRFGKCEQDWWKKIPPLQMTWGGRFGKLWTNQERTHKTRDVTHPSTRQRHNINI